MIHDAKGVTECNILDHTALWWQFSSSILEIQIGNLSVSPCQFNPLWDRLCWFRFRRLLFSIMAGVEATQPAQVDISKTSSVPAEGYDKKCIFCKIINNEMGTELLHCVRIL